MKGFISVGVSLLIVYLIAAVSLIISTYTALKVNETSVIAPKSIIITSTPIATPAVAPTSTPSAAPALILRKVSPVPTTGK